MRKCILVISGFTQDNYENTGSRELWEKLLPYRAMCSHDDMVFVELKEWNYDWKDFAKWLNSLNVSECFVAAYSWGAGYGLREFSKHFLGTITAVLCDPVYRSKWVPLRWLAFLDMTIKYPKNVRVAKWFYQKMDEPGGDKVANAPKGTRLSVPHSQMDQHPAYHQACIKEVKKFLNG